MYELSLIVSRTLNVLTAVYLMVNADIAVRRAVDPAQRYGRMSLGLFGVGMLLTQAKFLSAGRMSDASNVFEIGTVLMLIGVVLLVRMYWKFPEVRRRSIDLVSFRS